MSHHTADCETVAEARARTLYYFLCEELEPNAMERDDLASLRHALDDWSHADIDAALDALVALDLVHITPGRFGVVYIAPIVTPRLRAVPA